MIAMGELSFSCARRSQQMSKQWPPRLRTSTTLRCPMPSTGVLTTDDIDQIGHLAFGSGSPPGDLVAELVGAVDQGLVADQADTGYALMLAAEIAERDGDLLHALALTERAIRAKRVHRQSDGYARTYRAQLLLRLGREDEGMDELTQLRPLLSQDPDAGSYLSDALVAGGRAETAQQWLTVALATALQRRHELEAQRGTPQYTDAASVAFLLAQRRRGIRSDLGLPRDEYDDLADRLANAVCHALAGDEPDHQTVRMLFWPHPEFGALMQRWPALAEVYGQTWGDYRARVQQALTAHSQCHQIRLSLLAGSVQELAAHAQRSGGDPADPEVRQAYARTLTNASREIPWPPGRNQPCWCGAPQKYKKCCLPRARS